MHAASLSRASLLALVGLLAASAGGAADPPDGLRVTIAAITASDRHTSVHPKLTEIAKAVQTVKETAALTGYRLERTTCKPVTVGRMENFPLVEDASADITVLQDDKQRVRLAVKAPLVGEITYQTCYDKFFPIVTRYLTTKDRERLIVAIMVTSATKDAKGGK
jgi:hypothetical protein